MEEKEQKKIAELALKYWFIYNQNAFFNPCHG
jgi:hypothetical protein